jgi:hypothetical protein
VVIVPEPFKILVLVVLTPVDPAVVVVVLVSCASAKPNAAAQAAPAANIFTNLVCFILIPLFWLNGYFPSCFVRAGACFD